jgi:hypothetical protein
MVWPFITVATAGATLLLTLYAVRALADVRTLFVVVAIWARYVLSAFHEYTTPSLVAGFSLISLFSIAVTFIGLALVPIRWYFRAFLALLPLLLLLFIIIVSGVLNTEYGGLVKDMTKWLYFAMLFLLIYRAFVLFDTDTVLRGLFAASLTPLALQILSIVLGQGSFDPTVGKIVYIGGYGGSAAFTLSLYTTLCLAALVNWRYSVTHLGIALICVAGIYIAQYRTTILAALPLLAVLSSIIIVNWTPKILRPLSLLYVVVCGLGVAVVSIQFMPPNFYDIIIVLQSWVDLAKRPEFFLEAERELFSGRIYIWSNYLTTWWHGSPLVHLFGFGPEAWEGVEQKYAHNTFVSYVYEFGIVGLSGLLVFFGVQLVTATRARPPSLAWRLTAALSGFLIANLATMPLWMIEGLILLAVLCALAWAEADVARSVSPRGERTPIGARWAGRRPAQPARDADVGGGRRLLGR